MADNTEEYGVVLTAKDKTRKAVQAAEAGITKIVKKYDTMAQKSEKVSKGVGKDLGGMVKGYLALGVGVAAAYKTIQASYRFVSEAIDLAGKQQAAEIKLATAIEARGLVVDEVMPKILEDAAALQRLTGAADETTIANQALSVSLGLPIERMEDLALAMVNAEAAGLGSADSIQRNLIKSLSGLSGELGEAVPAIRSLTKEELKAGKAIDLINEAFAGQAEALKTTLPGAIKFAKGGFSDLLESMGGAVGESKVLRAALIATGEVFLDTAGGISDSNSIWAESTNRAVSFVIAGFETLLIGMQKVKKGWLITQKAMTGYEKAALSVRESQLEQSLVSTGLKDDLSNLDEVLERLTKREERFGSSLAAMSSDQVREAADEIRRLRNQYIDAGGAAEHFDTELAGVDDKIQGITDTFDIYRIRVAELAAGMGELKKGALGLGDGLDDLEGSTKRVEYAAGDFSKAWDQGVSRALLHTANAGEILQQVLDDTADTTFRGTVAAYDELIARSDILTMKSGELWGVIEGFPVDTLAQFRGEFALWMDEALNGTEATEEGLRNLIVRMGAFTEAQEAMSESALAAWRGYSEGIENFGVKATNIALGTIEQLYDSAFSAIGTIITDNIAQVTGMGDEWRKVVGVVIDALVKIAAAAIASGAAQGLAGAAAAAGKGAATAQTWQTAIAAAIAVAGSVIATVLATIGTAETYESGIKGASGGLFAGGTPNVDSINATVMPGELLMPTDVAAAYLEEKRASRDRRQGGGDGMTVNYAPQYGAPFVPDSRIGFQRKAQEHLLEFDREMEILGRTP